MYSGERAVAQGRFGHCWTTPNVFVLSFPVKPCGLEESQNAITSLDLPLHVHRTVRPFLLHMREIQVQQPSPKWEFGGQVTETSWVDVFKGVVSLSLSPLPLLCFGITLKQFTLTVKRCLQQPHLRLLSLMSTGDEMLLSHKPQFKSHFVSPSF